jgi:hypothetical protein
MRRIWSEWAIARITTKSTPLTGTCRAGHEYTVVVTTVGHAVLYERALQRLADEDWRDAVLDSYTALDMYFATVPDPVPPARNGAGIGAP